MKAIKKSIKKFLLFFLFLFLIVISTASAEKKVIICLSSSKHTPFQDTFSGFKKAVKKQNVTIKRYYTEDTKDSILKTIQEEKPILIFTIGTKATKIVKDNITKTPVVFSFVVDPVDKKYIKTKESSQNNLCGVSMEIPIEKQFKMIKKTFPEAINIGILYSSERKHVIVKAEKIATALNLNLIKYEVKDKNEVKKALNQITKKIDLLWSIPDTTVFSFSTSRQILAHTYQNKIPFMSFSPQYVNSGSLFALYCDFKDIGEQSGKIALRIINGKESPSSIPLESPKKILLAFNMTIAKRLGLQIPEEVENDIDLRLHP